MSMTNVWIFLGILGLLFIITSLITCVERIKLRREVRRNWGRPARRTRKDSEASLKEAWQMAQKYTAFDAQVDELTWYDLDLFSVFQNLNSTQSSIGSEALYQRLRHYNLSSEDNARLEKLILFFEAHPDRREQVRYQFACLGKRDHNFVAQYLSETKSQKLPNLTFYLICACLPIVALIVAIFQPVLGVLLLIGSLVFNICYYQFKKVALETELNSMSYLVQTIAIAKKVAKIQTPFQTALVDNLKPIQAISRVGLSFRVKTGSEGEVFFDYLNAVVMLPFIAYNLVISKIMHHDQEAKKVWQLLGELEVALAILNLQVATDTAICQPVFTTDFKVSATDMTHPLLEDAVANPVNWQKHLLVTGSNASGKSSYVKALAINCILANAINRVYATAFSLPRAHVVTSMAIEDNIFEGDSYFIAEIKSVKRILDLVSNQIPCLCFVDEILKGTNTIERISASSSLVHWLANYQEVLSMVATHDIELTEILARDCDNIHFEEKITESNGVTFDYRCKVGPAKTRNAIALLEVLHYPEAVVANASTMAENFDKIRKWQVLEQDTTVASS